MLKKELRRLYRKKRTDLSMQDVAELSTSIVVSFAASLPPLPQYLLSYSPLAETNEFNVGLCEDVIKTRSSDLRVAWPKISMDNLSMEAHLVEGSKAFVKNQYNILEPLNGDVLDPVLIDMIFIPLLAFDSRGYRVGYGKGFYDRYLPQCSPNVLKIGFSFFDAIPAISDIDQFDVPLDLCFTPTRIYEF